MKYHLDRKPAGCKLLRVDLEVEEGILVDLRVRGDFFAHPEELFEEAEEEVGGLRLELGLPSSPDPSAGMDSLRAAALRAFSRPGLGLYGASAEAIADTVVEAGAQARSAASLGGDGGGRENR